MKNEKRKETSLLMTHNSLLIRTVIPSEAKESNLNEE